MAGRRANRFLAYVHWEPEPIAWDPHDESQEPFPGSLYYARILANVDRLAPERGLTFIVTSNLRRLPEYGEHVVVLVREDEWCRVPAYSTRVRAVFKTYGTTLTWVRPRRALPTSVETLAVIQNLRTLLKSLPFAIRSLLRRRFRRGRVYDMPLGYFKQLDLAYVPMADRTLDASFQGSSRNKTTPKTSLRSWLRTPKTLSRDLLLERLADIRARHPEFAIAFELTKNFWDVGISEAEKFSRTMMETRICVVPRGTSLETYRFFEALRYGCIVIAEPLPNRSYYDGSPIVRVADWTELEAALVSVLSDRDRLQEWSQRSLAWWKEHASESAVAASIVRRID